MHVVLRQANNTQTAQHYTFLWIRWLFISASKLSLSLNPSPKIPDFVCNPHLQNCRNFACPILKSSYYQNTGNHVSCPTSVNCSNIARTVSSIGSSPGRMPYRVEHLLLIAVLPMSNIVFYHWHSDGWFSDSMSSSFQCFCVRKQHFYVVIHQITVATVVDFPRPFPVPLLPSLDHTRTLGSPVFQAKPHITLNTLQWISILPHEYYNSLN